MVAATLLDDGAHDYAHECVPPCARLSASGPALSSARFSSQIDDATAIRVAAQPNALGVKGFSAKQLSGLQASKLPSWLANVSLKPGLPNVAGLSPYRAQLAVST